MCSNHNPDVQPSLFSVTNQILLINSLPTVLLCVSVSSDLHTFSQSIQSLSGNSSGLARCAGWGEGWGGFVTWWGWWLRSAGCPLSPTCLSPRLGSSELWPILPELPGPWVAIHRGWSFVSSYRVPLPYSFLVWTPGPRCAPALSAFPYPHSCLPNLSIYPPPSASAAMQIPCWMWLWAERRGSSYLVECPEPSSIRPSFPQLSSSALGDCYFS